MKNTKRNPFTIITVTISRIQRADKLEIGRDKNINIIRNLLIQWKSRKDERERRKKKNKNESERERSRSKEVKKEAHRTKQANDIS